MSIQDSHNFTAVTSNLLNLSYNNIIPLITILRTYQYNSSARNADYLTAELWRLMFKAIYSAHSHIQSSRTIMNAIQVPYGVYDGSLWGTTSTPCSLSNSSISESLISRPLLETSSAGRFLSSDGDIGTHTICILEVRRWWELEAALPLPSGSYLKWFSVLQ